MLSGRATSVWMDTAPHTTYPPLEAALSVDACVVGGGILGLLTADLLKRAGMSVAVLEADRVATGVTGYTTAKVTVLHGLVYDEVRSHFGADGARDYAEANTAGLALIAGRVAEAGIECDFRRRAAYTYAEDGADLGKLRKEVDAARAAGLDAELVGTVDLPWPVAGAVRIADQAEFHPRRFLLSIAQSIDADGSSFVFERTRVTGVDDARPCRVRTAAGGEVRAQVVVLATHYPTLDRGLFFARLAAERSYALGIRARGRAPEGMFLSTESPSHSVRSTPYEGGELLIVGGESHKTGTGDTMERYAALEAWARERFDVEAVEYRWSAQDAMPLDGIPYVGKLSPIARSIWTASGFKKWGMTNGAAAAIMLADAITGRENPWARTFDANRFKPLAAPKLLREQISVGAHFLGDRLAAPGVRSLDALAPGEGGIVRVDGDKVAAFRDDDGVVHAVSPICTHLFCEVSFNAAERSWDCPCHGSRFGTDGTVLEGPAVNPLERKAL